MRGAAVHGPFSEQFFAITPLPGMRVLLAGGLDPLLGSRSAFQATVLCFDYSTMSVVWRAAHTKSYPFRSVAHRDGVCAAMLPFNFVRCPTGLFRFDVERGDCVPTVQEFQVKSVAAGVHGFVFASVTDATSFIGTVGPRGASVRRRALPYQSAGGGKTIERAFWPDDGGFLALLSFVQGPRVVYSLERWDWESDAPVWERPTRHRRLVQSGGELVGWSSEGNLQIDSYSLDNTGQPATFQVPLADAVDVQPLGAGAYAIAALSGLYVFDTGSGELTPLAGIDSDDVLDFISIAIDAAQRKLIVITTGNYQRPGTMLFLVDY